MTPLETDSWTNLGSDETLGPSQTFYQDLLAIENFSRIYNGVVTPHINEGCVCLTGLSYFQTAPQNPYINRVKVGGGRAAFFII